MAKPKYRSARDITTDRRHNALIRQEMKRSHLGTYSSHGRPEGLIREQRGRLKATQVAGDIGYWTAAIRVGAGYPIHGIALTPLFHTAQSNFSSEP